MSEQELPDISLTQLQPMVVMPESNDEIIDTLQLGSYSSDVIIRDDPMMSQNPLNNSIYKGSLVELKNQGTPVMYEMLQLLPQSYTSSVKQKQQQPTVSYIDVEPVQVAQEENNTAKYTNYKQLKTEIKQEKQKPYQNKIKRRNGRKEPAEKVYEKSVILDDPEAERKRQNAILAKQNREKQKNRLIELESQVASLTCERDSLLATSEKYRRRSQLFEEHLRKVCSQFGVPIVIVTE